MGEKLTFTSGNDLSTSLLGLLNDTGDPLESGLVDDGSGKVSPFGARSDSDAVDLLDQRVLESTLPHRLGNVTSGESRTFLSRVLESGSDSLDDTRFDIGRWVVQVEVLSA
jgi:hypothetical protein